MNSPSSQKKVFKQIQPCPLSMLLQAKRHYMGFSLNMPSQSNGCVAIGGTLSNNSLIEAYANGVFPWFETLPVLWYSPSQRPLFLSQDSFKVSKSFRKFLKTKTCVRNSAQALKEDASENKEDASEKELYHLAIDRNFSAVIQSCAMHKRASQKDDAGTWIGPEMLKAYTDLHRLGLAHSIEVYRDNNLVGGLYGVSLGRAFFGESMFSKESNTSKLALLALTQLSKVLESYGNYGFLFIDCQQASKHIMSLGAELHSKKNYRLLMVEAMSSPCLKGLWTELESPLSHSLAKEDFS